MIYLTQPKARSNVCVTVSKIRIEENPICNISIPGYEFVYEDSPSNAGGAAMCV